MSEENLEDSDQKPTESEDNRSDLLPHNVPTAMVQVDLAAQSHPGLIRENNEDHYLVVRITRSLQTIMTNLTHGVLPQRYDESALGRLVADGMGGHAAGEVASSMAMLRLLELGEQTPDWMMKMDASENAAVIMRRMTNRFRQID